jgi:hypothetical protein
MACVSAQIPLARAAGTAARPVCGPALPGRRRAAPAPAAPGRLRACSCSCAASTSAPEASTTASALSWVLARPARQEQQRQQPLAQAREAAAPVAVAAAAPAAARAAAPPPPMAALRLLLTGQNNTIQKALAKGPKGGGPISLLLFALTLIAACFAALRNALVRKVRGCKCCRGYGVIRCRLCDGEGRVDWAAKLSHFDACPLCMNRRYVVCSECGGGYQRPLFSHARRRQGGAQEASDVYANLAAAGAGAAVGAAVGVGSAPGSAMSSLDLSDGISSARND